MELKLKPTGILQPINGVMTRCWEGETDQGVPVHAYVALVSPQTHDAAVNDQFARELQEVTDKIAPATMSWPMRRVVD